MRLLEPDLAAWALTAVAVGIGWTIRTSYRWSARRRWPAYGAGHRRTAPLRDLAILALAMLAVGLLAAALLRPQVRDERMTPVFEKQDLVLLLDRSVSMRARDIPPSRSARAVEEIETFLRGKPATLDRIALIGFASTSVVLSYPTADLDSLFFYLDWVRDDPSTLYGTDIGGALETALGVAEKEESRLPPVFVLVSDGEQQGAGLDRAVAAVRRAGIRIYTVGIGTGQRVPMYVRTDAGRDEILRDEAGQVMWTRFEEGTLRRLAAITGGQYFRSASGGDLRRALDRIFEHERRAIGATARLEYRDLYPLLLAAAAVALLGLVTIW